MVNILMKMMLVTLPVILCYKNLLHCYPYSYLLALWSLTLISTMVDILMKKKTYMLEEINWKGNGATS
jgi:hypothetical protein